MPPGIWSRFLLRIRWSSVPTCDTRACARSAKDKSLDATIVSTRVISFNDVPVRHMFDGLRSTAATPPSCHRRLRLLRRVDVIIITVHRRDVTSSYETFRRVSAPNRTDGSYVLCLFAVWKLPSDGRRPLCRSHDTEFVPGGVCGQIPSIYFSVPTDRHIDNYKTRLVFNSYRVVKR